MEHGNGLFDGREHKRRWKQPTSSRFIFRGKQKGLISKEIKPVNVPAGDKRDRTADVLNVIQALSLLERLHTPTNRAETARQYMELFIVAVLVMYRRNYS